MEKYHAARFKQLRERLEFTPAEFANMLDITQDVLYSIETGSIHPDPETIERFVDVAIDYLNQREIKRFTKPT